MIEIRISIGGCSKVDYKSESTAKKACASMKKKGSDGLEPYQCEWCQGWHIGHSL